MKRLLIICGIAIALIAPALYVPMFASAQDTCTQSVKELVTAVQEADASVSVRVYTGEDAAKIIDVASKQSGQEVDADTVTVMFNEGNGIIMISKGDCAKLGGRGTAMFIRSIIAVALGSDA